MIKPSWRNAPKWANWVAQDQQGTWMWYQYKPIPAFGKWVFEGKALEIEHGVSLVSGWKKSLENRQ